MADLEIGIVATDDTKGGLRDAQQRISKFGKTSADDVGKIRQGV